MLHPLVEVVDPHRQIWRRCFTFGSRPALPSMSGPRLLNVRAHRDRPSSFGLTAPPAPESVQAPLSVHPSLAKSLRRRSITHDVNTGVLVLASSGYLTHLFSLL